MKNNEIMKWNNENDNDNINETMKKWNNDIMKMKCK